MKKTYTDGTVVEGTPVEIREYEKAAFPSATPEQIQEAIKLTPTAPPPFPPQGLVSDWTSGTIKITSNPRLVGSTTMVCAKEEFFKQNPKATSALIHCGCPKCCNWTL